jgi:hypothetical protein
MKTKAGREEENTSTCLEENIHVPYSQLVEKPTLKNFLQH